MGKTPTKPKKESKSAKHARRTQLRAISTPNKNESYLQSNVTINAAEISAIPVLTPPTTRKAKSTVREASFQFRKNRGQNESNRTASASSRSKNDRANNFQYNKIGSD